MKSMKSTLLLAAAAVAFAAVGSAQANVVDIQFLGTTGHPPATSFSGSQGAYTGDGVASPTWNGVTPNATTGAGSATNLLASNGAATTDSVSFTSTNSYVSTPTTTFGNAGGTNNLLEGVLE